MASGRASSRGSTYLDVQLNLNCRLSFLKEGIAARTIMTKGSIVEEILTPRAVPGRDLVAIPRRTVPACSTDVRREPVRARGAALRAAGGRAGLHSHDDEGDGRADLGARKDSGSAQHFRHFCIHIPQPRTAS
jgi:hypothetical protein